MFDTKRIDNLRNVLLGSKRGFKVVETGEREILFPTYDLYARDYLLAAEVELNSYSTKQGQSDSYVHLINCVAHLKRAIDSELDVFLSVYNLHHIFKKHNLKIEKKLEFLYKAGVYSSRTLARLNSIRNRMEHSYEVPKVSDIELYYDLVSTFVALLERSITFARYEYIVFEITEDKKVIGAISFTYDFGSPGIQVDWSIWKPKSFYLQEEDDIQCAPTEYETFPFLFKIMQVLIEIDNFVSRGYLARYLQN